jgi:hypothetical protein
MSIRSQQEGRRWLLDDYIFDGATKEGDSGLVRRWAPSIYLPSTVIMKGRDERRTTRRFFVTFAIITP